METETGESRVPRAVEDELGIDDSPVKARKVGCGCSDPELLKLERTLKMSSPAQREGTCQGSSTREMETDESHPELSLPGHGCIPGLRRHREV